MSISDRVGNNSNKIYLFIYLLNFSSQYTWTFSRLSIPGHSLVLVYLDNLSSQYTWTFSHLIVSSSFDSHHSILHIFQLVLSLLPSGLLSISSHNLPKPSHYFSLISFDMATSHLLCHCSFLILSKIFQALTAQFYPATVCLPFTMPMGIIKSFLKRPYSTLLTAQLT